MARPNPKTVAAPAAATPPKPAPTSSDLPPEAPRLEPVPVDESSGSYSLAESTIEEAPARIDIEEEVAEALQEELAKPEPVTVEYPLPQRPGEIPRRPWVRALAELGATLTRDLVHPVQLLGEVAPLKPVDLVVQLVLAGEVEAGRALCEDLVNLDPRRGARLIHSALQRAGAMVAPR